jgi:hypothetical protein
MPLLISRYGLLAAVQDMTGDWRSLQKLLDHDLAHAALRQHGS